MLLDRPIARPMRPRRRLSLPVFRRRPPDAGQAHSCGLRHRSTCESWSLMTAILWWLLRSDR